MNDVNRMVYTVFVQEAKLDERRSAVEVKAGVPLYEKHQLEVRFTVPLTEAAHYVPGKLLRFYLDESE